MKLIELGGKNGSKIGNYAQVDDDDYEYLNQWRWTCRKRKKDNVSYAGRSITINHKRETVLMHRLIMEVTNPKIYTDHKDGNGLNNQKDNLREADTGQNSANRRCSSKSKYLGVIKVKTCNSWRVKVTKNKIEHVVYCKTKEEAALKYNQLAMLHHGKYAKLNIVI